MGQEPDQIRWRGVQPVAGIRGVWPAIDAERVNESGYTSNANTTIIYTVPASKKLFIDGDLMTSLLTAVATVSGKMGVRDAGDVLVYWMQYHYYAAAGQTTVAMPHVPAIEAEAGYDVFVTSGHANMSVRGTIFGWLEDD